VLKKEGVFIVLDAYRKRYISQMTKDELLAVKLTEAGMAVSEFKNYPSLLGKAKKLGFTVELSEDVSIYILPTLRKFERHAIHFFKRPKIARAMTKLFPKEVTYNAISGLFMPYLIKHSLASYFITVLKSE